MSDTGEAVARDIVAAILLLRSAIRATKHERGCDCSVCWAIGAALAELMVAENEAALLEDEEEDENVAEAAGP